MPKINLNKTTNKFVNVSRGALPNVSAGVDLDLPKANLSSVRKASNVTMKIKESIPDVDVSKFTGQMSNATTTIISNVTSKVMNVSEFNLTCDNECLADCVDNDTTSTK